MQEHDAKYRKLARRLGVRLTEDSLSLFGLKDVWDLRRKMAEDQNLNNIPMKYFDSMRRGLILCNIRLTKAEATCMYKALLRQLAMSNPEQKKEDK